MEGKGKVGIVGSGFIGRGWAMLFASVGYSVSIYDVQPSAVDNALNDIKKQLEKLEDTNLLRGTLSAIEQFKLISKAKDLKDCVEDSCHVQECVFERLDLKQEVFKQLDEIACDRVVLCSSTSCFPASSFSEDLKHRSQVIVGHPVNPPYYVPLVELIPAPWTDPNVITRTRALMTEIGQKPVTLKKEVPGFALNRIQYALINECWRIVESGLMSMKDVDTSMCEGLGLRYAFIGPLETCHLNAEGMKDYCSRYGKGIYDVSQTFGPNPKLAETAEKMHEEVCEFSPLDELAERRKWRDAHLAALSKMKMDLTETEKH